MRSFSIDVLSGGQKLVYYLLVLVWLATLTWFWLWWLQPIHIANLVRFLITCFILFTITVPPLWYFYFVGRMKKPNPKLPLPPGRVAMVVTKAPAEPWPMVQKTLLAMKNQVFDRSYDVWLADERPTAETRAWCNANEIFISTRHGHPDYHNTKWPRRKKCKEGNLAYFYDHFGYENYDFVVQLDADHVPEEGYLHHMIQPFINPKIGYVAAPSICDANRDTSWTVRGRLFVESVLHGPLQAGYSSVGSPLCIGSHYAVRSQALFEIGGLGPELAEDHSTSLMMNAGGWHGAFALDAIAHGDGATSIGDSMTQEFQWAQSLTRIALEWMPKFRKGLSFTKTILFGFAQTWYPLLAVQMMLGVISPSFALWSNTPWAVVNYFDFFWRFTLLTATTLFPVMYIRTLGVLRPVDAKLFAWEPALFQVVRWPWSALGCLVGLINAVLHLNFTFKITPKGKDNQRPLSFAALMPYILIVFASIYMAITFGTATIIEGYRWLAILDAVIYTIALLAIVFMHLVENYKSFWAILTTLPGFALNMVSLLLIYIFFASNPFPQFLKPSFAQSSIPTPASTLAPVIAPTYVGVREDVKPTVVPTRDSFTEEVNNVIPIFPTATPQPIVVLPQKKILTGMYDPAGEFNDTQFDIQNAFVDWKDPHAITIAIAASQKLNRFPMITTQPISNPYLDPSTLLPDIIAGKYDDVITDMALTIGKESPQMVIIRWGHEMDLCGVYEWSSCVTEDYIAAYRHVVDLTRSLGVNNILWMWAPAGGNANTNSFYPGDGYVDYIGITGLVSEDWDRYFKVEPAPQDFITLLHYRYKAAETYHKPLIVAEFGISFSNPYTDRTQWLRDAFTIMKHFQGDRYPYLAGWVYFNEFTKPNPRIGVLPDFRISRKELFSALELSGGFSE